MNNNDKLPQVLIYLKKKFTYLGSIRILVWSGTSNSKTVRYHQTKRRFFRLYEQVEPSIPNCSSLAKNVVVFSFPRLAKNFCCFLCFSVHRERERNRARRTKQIFLCVWHVVLGWEARRQSVENKWKESENLAGCVATSWPNTRNEK